MSVAVKVRRVIARRPWLYWAACVIPAAAVAMLVGGHVARLDEARRSWSDTERVLVATADHRPGEPLHAEAVEMPLAVVPPDAVDASDATSVAGSIVRQRVVIGEVVVTADLAVPDGPAALAAPGTLVVGLTDPLARDVRIGLQVHVVAEGVVLADDARVVGLADEVIFVAVDAQGAAMVAAAAHDNTASVVFVP